MNRALTISVEDEDDAAFVSHPCVLPQVYWCSCLPVLMSALQVMPAQSPTLTRVTSLLAGALVALGVQEHRPALNLWPVLSVTEQKLSPGTPLPENGQWKSSVSAWPCNFHSAQHRNTLHWKVQLCSEIACTVFAPALNTKSSLPTSFPY